MLLVSLSLPACAARVFEGAGEESQADAGAEIPLGGVQVSGQAVDYWERVPLADAQILARGVARPDGLPFEAVSGSTGGFIFEDFPTSSTFYAEVAVGTEGLGYRSTLSQPVRVLTEDLSEELYVVSDAYVNLNATTVGLEVQAGTAVLIADLRDDADRPLSGLGRGELSLVDAAGVGVGDGPYFLGRSGIIDPELSRSRAYEGESRVIFLNVPVGEHELRALSSDSDPDPATARVFANAEGVQLLSLAPRGPVATEPGFAADVYPLLQAASQGGQGCATCHQAGGMAGFLVFNDPDPEVVRQALLDARVIDYEDPRDSRILRKPLYEDPPNHPNAAWLSTEAAGYQTILNWIEQDAHP